METKNFQSTNLYEKRWAALALLCTAQFMVIMDTSIIGVALPAIKSALNFSQSGLQWIFNAYVIFFGGLLLLGGKLSDIVGPKKIFIAGFVILTLASLLAGIAWSPASMNVGRALQGVGSALLAPAALTLLMSMFTDPKEIARAMGFWGASAAAGGSAGVFLGGVITQWMSWRWVFLINIPMALIVLWQSRSLLIEGISRKGKVDLLGALTITASLVLMVYAIVTAEGSFMNEKFIGLLTLSILLFVGFIVLQKAKSEPLISLSIFSAPNLSPGNTIMAMMAAAWIPLWFFLNLYLQQVLHFSAFTSGLALLPMTIVIMFLMVRMTGKLVGRFGFKKNLVAGLLSLTASLFLFSRVPEHGSFLIDVLPASLLGALGMSLAYIPGTIASMSGAKPEETGLASGIVNTSYQIGSALGLAIIVAIATSVTASAQTSGATEISALNSGFRTAFIAAGAICSLATIGSAIFIKVPKHGQQ